MRGVKSTKAAAKAPVTQAGGKAQFVTTVTPIEGTPQPKETHEELGQGMLTWA